VDDLDLVYQVLLALGLGLLVGFQRQWASAPVAGIRTYPLITVFGVLSVFISESAGGWVIAVGLVAVAVFVAIGNVQEFRKGRRDTGITSEMSALVMFGVGCAIGLGQPLVAVIVTGAAASLLHWKGLLHGFVKRVGEQDLNAIFRLVLVAMVILPVLPNEDYGPHGVLNPFEIWLMVALIVGISLGAYIAFKLLGQRGGAIVTGLLGGMISSTATTFSYARLARKTHGGEALGAMIIVIASAVVLVRVMFEIAIVAPDFLREAGPPLAILFGVVTVLAAALSVHALRAQPAPLEVTPSVDLKSAVAFGLLYAGVLVAVAFAKQFFGTSGLYTVAAVSGLTDMDAITLSTAQLVKSGELDAGHAWRMIVVGMISNLAFKGAAVGILGDRKLLVRVGSAFAVTTAVGVSLIVLWK
jgi:uncharacterized membrane protein (DUF4010 family)